MTKIAGSQQERHRVQSLNRMLRFAPQIDAIYEAEHGQERVAALRHVIYVGLVLYNAYNLTSIALMPDILWLSVALRVLLVTPISLALAWLIGRVPPQTREFLVFSGVLNAFLVPVFLFWLTDASLGAYTFGELGLTIVFGNMLLALRFRQALIFTAAAFAAATVAVALKTGLVSPLKFAFVVQIGTACLFSLYANYLMESRRCRDYLATLNARTRAEAAEEARQRFQDLSLTDALTGLPNRRLLNQCLDTWCADRRALVLMMIDIDHFKLFNDTLGHPAGDDCLRSIASVLTAVAEGPNAVCARFGGEEFTLAVRDAGDFEAVRLANGLVHAIEALGILHPGRRDGMRAVTASIGVAFKPAGVMLSRERVLEEADEALYQAKRRGRNRYVVATAKRLEQSAAG